VRFSIPQFIFIFGIISITSSLQQQQPAAAVAKASICRIGVIDHTITAAVRQRHWLDGLSGLDSCFEKNV